MSRILRRPMFRGGSVDSRGTGITSGLGYEKGGRVGLRLGGDTLFNAVNQAKNFVSNIGPQLPKGLSNLLYRAPLKTLAGGVGLGAGVGTGIGLLTDAIVKAGDTPEAYAYRKKAVRDDPFAYSETDVEINPDGTMTSRGQQIDEEIAKLDVGEKYGFMPRGGGEKRLEEMGLTGKFDSSGDKIIQEIIEEQITNDNKKENYNNQFRKTNDTEESTEISKEDIEKNKELFAELLGGGKARGEDISNMLMSFAGKALKPEATVKGAFGEFFEEEAKRPSSKTKVDQAAAQLAINDYIAGKRSKEATESLLARLKTQAKLGAPDLYDNIVKIAGPGSNPTTSNLESALKVTEDTRGKPVTKIKKAFKDDGSKNYTIEEKDYDSFIITENPKTIIYIDVNGVEKQIY